MCMGQKSDLSEIVALCMVVAPDVKSGLYPPHIRLLLMTALELLP